MFGLWRIWLVLRLTRIRICMRVRILLWRLVRIVMRMLRFLWRGIGGMWGIRRIMGLSILLVRSLRNCSLRCGLIYHSRSRSLKKWVKFCRILKLWHQTNLTRSGSIHSAKIPSFIQPHHPNLNPNPNPKQTPKSQ